jgi:hypothetical protein
MHPENKSKILATTATVLTFGLTSCAEGFVSPTQNSPDDNANHPRPANTLEAQNSGQEQQSQQEISKQQVQLDRYLVDRALGEWKEIRYSQETWRAENPKFEIDNSISHPRNPDGSVNENKLVTIAFNDIAQPDNGDKKTGRFAWLI